MSISDFALKVRPCWKGSSVIRSTGCFLKGPSFIPNTHMATQTSTGNAHMRSTGAHAGKPPIHINKGTKRTKTSPHDIYCCKAAITEE